MCARLGLIDLLSDSIMPETYSSNIQRHWVQFVDLGFVVENAHGPLQPGCLFNNEVPCDVHNAVWASSSKPVADHKKKNTGQVLKQKGQAFWGTPFSDMLCWGPFAASRLLKQHSQFSRANHAQHAQPRPYSHPDFASM